MVKAIILYTLEHWFERALFWLIIFLPSLFVHMALFSKPWAETKEILHRQLEGKV